MRTFNEMKKRINIGTQTFNKMKKRIKTEEKDATDMAFILRT